MSIVDFMKQSNYKPKKATNTRLVDDYLSIIDDKVVNIQDTNTDDFCPQCEEKMFLNQDDCFIFCESCNYFDAQ